MANIPSMRGKAPPLAMHRVAAVKRGGGDGPRPDAAKPVDFLKRLEQIEAIEEEKVAGPAPAQLHPVGRGPGRLTDAFNPHQFNTVKMPDTKGEDAEQLLRELQNSIDAIRTRKRERTPEAAPASSQPM